MSAAFPIPAIASPVTIFLSQGRSFETAGETHKAFAAYSSAIILAKKIEPTNARPLLHRASLISKYPAQFNQDQGLKDTMDAIALPPISEPYAPFLIRSRIHANKNDPSMLLVDSSTGLALSPNNLDLLFYRAQSYLQFPDYAGYESRFDLAAKDLTKLLSQNPADPTGPLLLRAEAHISLNQTDKAYRDLSLVLQSPQREKALPLFGRLVPIILQNAAELRSQGKFGDAYNEVQKILVHEPDHLIANQISLDLLSLFANSITNSQATEQKTE